MAVPSLRQQPAGDDASPHLAFVELQASAYAPDDWLSAAYDLTPRLERVSARSALLDLGICDEREAWEAAQTLLGQIAGLSLGGCIGVGPSCAVAQLAVLATLTGPAPLPLITIAPAAAPTFLRMLPVTLLPKLHPKGLVCVEQVQRLQEYGLRTLGHLARLGERALVRQFGALGRFLAAVAAGRDARPLCPTPQPATLQFRLRLPTTAAPESVLLALASLAERTSRHLARRAAHAGLVRLILTWERGRVSSGQTRLRIATNEARILAQQVQRLGSLLLAEGPAGQRTQRSEDQREDQREDQSEALAQVLLEVGEIGPIVPAQTTLWRTEAQKQAALAQATELLAGRYGRPQIFRPVCVAEAAIFRWDRYRLQPLAPDAVPAAASAGMPVQRPVQRHSRGTPPDTPLAEATAPWDRVP
jgi:nucleotidyltransferase/DNA polymerase involved in DNA repair